MQLFLLKIRKVTSATYDRGMDESLRDNNHILREVNLIKNTVEFDKGGLADPESRKLQEMNLYQENAGEALVKLKGVGPRDVGAISPEIDFSYMFFM